MAGENLESTVLHEHRKVVAFRHILALVNFIAILAGTLVTRHYVLIRGNSDAVVLLLNIIMAINAVQIALCLADYILKAFFGRYIGALVKVSYGVGGAWLIATIVQVVIGSLELGALRIDLLVIAVLQLFTALIAYIVWPALDHLAIRAMTRPNVREDLDKRASKAKKSVLTYGLVCTFMILIQAGMLFAYKLPPKVYDIFAESRALQYELNEDGTGYNVVGVYKGTSSYVNVPAVYNNLPVVKISEGALSDVTFIEKYKIDTIEIGTLTTDENGKEKFLSNVTVIESGAIVNDKITNLRLPLSVLKIDPAAIQSTSLKTVIYESKAEFVYATFSCPALARITFEGDEAGKILSLEGMSSTTTIEVAKDIYNTYREKNKEYMHSLRPILSDTEFVVDFYTDSDYYINSIFANIGEKVELGYQDLKNDAMLDLVAPSVDTLAYIGNRHETGTMGTKADSAFRGWYYDGAFTDECVFDASGKVSFTKDTAIYAKWIDEYNGTLNWDTYHPEGEPTVLYWTDEDLVTFPVIEGREGYADGIKWTVDGTEVTSSQNISKSVALEGEWVLDAPVVSIVSTPHNPSDPTFVISTGEGNVSFVYDEMQKVDLAAKMSHALSGVSFNGKTFKYETKWIKKGSSETVSENQLITLQDVIKSGEYVLEVTARSPWGETKSSEAAVSVNISRKPLDIGDAVLNNFSGVYNATNQHAQVVKGTNPGHDRVVIEYSYFNKAGEKVSVDDGVKNAGRYTVKALFKKNNDQEAANYDTKELVAEFVITPAELGFVGWTDADYTYNSKNQGVYVSFSGIYPGDTVNPVYEDNLKADAGQYTAVVKDIDNTNYSIAEIREHCAKEWQIKPMQITVQKWLIDGSNTSDFTITYNGEEHTITAVPEGIYASDEGNVSFLYEDTANTFKATDANKYSVKITGVDNKNYVFVGEALKEWEIKKKPIQVYFDATTELVYNGASQKVSATLSGIAEKDLAIFSKNDFLYDGMTDTLEVSDPTVVDKRVVISFSAKNAATYKAVISAIDTAADINLNYTVSAVEKSFAITPKTISFVNDNNYTYSGKLQELTLKVRGIEASDLSEVKFDQFTTSTALAGKAEGEFYSLYFEAKDAGSYPIDVTAFDNTNYKMSSYSDNITIKQKNLTVNWKIENLADSSEAELGANARFTYNYSGYRVFVDINGVQNGENVELSYSGIEGKDAGSYVAAVSLPDTYKNYTLSAASRAWNIDPYTVDFTWKINGDLVDVENGNVPSFVYNANVYKVEPVYGLLGDDTVTILYASSMNDTVKTDASSTSYAVKIDSLGNSNYKVGNNGSFSWKILPKEVILTWSSMPASVVYDAAVHNVKFRIEGLLDTEDRYLPISLYNKVAQVSTVIENCEFSVGTLGSEYSVDGGAIDAGSYSFKADAVYKTGGVKDNNYTVKAAALDFEITKAPLELVGWTWENNGKGGALTSASKLVYNQGTFRVSNKIKTPLFARASGTDDVELYFSECSKSDAGDYKATAYLSGAHYNNYYIVDGYTVDWKVEPKPIKVTWTAIDFVYDGGYKEQKATVSNGASADDDLLVYTGDYINIIYSAGSVAYDAGNYVAAVDGLGNKNYVVEPSYATYSWKISPYTVTALNWSSSTLVYNGSKQSPTANYNGVYATEYDFGAGEGQNVGTYVVKATKLDSSNYVLSPEASQYYTYEITPRVAEFSWGFDNNANNAGDFTYDGTTKTLTAHLSNVCQSDRDKITLTYNKTDRAVRNVGTYELTVTAISNSNYVLTSSSRNISKTVTVSPKTVTISWGYNGATSGASDYVYDGAVRNLMAYVSNAYSGDSISLVLASEVKFKNVGTYTATVTGISGRDASNYQLPSGKSKTVTVSQRTLAFDWYFGDNPSNTAGNVTYTGSAYVLNAKPTAETLVEGDSVTLGYDQISRSFVSANTYRVTVTSLSGVSAANYKLPTGTKAYKEFTINRQNVTVEWSGNENTVYNGNPQALTATVKGVNDKKNVSFVYEGGVNSYTNAGEYEITVVLDNANYQFAGATRTKRLVISPQNVTIEWSGTQQLTYDGERHALSAVVKGANDKKHVNFSYYGGFNAYTNAGEYDISVVLNDDNYQIANAISAKRLVIEQREVTISWPSKTTYVYDGHAHSLTPTITGVGGVQLGGDYNTDYITNVGSQIYEVTAIHNSNYKLPSDGSARKILNVTPMEVTVTWIGTGRKTYTGSTYEVDVTVKDQNGNDVLYHFTTTTFFTEKGNNRVAISIDVDSSNYRLASGSYTDDILVIE